MHNPTLSRRRFLTRWLLFAGTMTAGALAPAQEGTPGMQRRQQRRDDRTSRLQERDDKSVARRDDPIGIRGPQRREDRRDLRMDRRTDRRERIN
jgi:hypothetical protein